MGSAVGLVTETAMEAISVSTAFSYSIRKKDKDAEVWIDVGCM